MFIVHINNPFWEKITQIFNISNLRIVEKINNISTASFEISISDENANYNNFKEFNKISIYKQENSLEKLLFSWIIKSVESNLEIVKIVKIELNDDLFLLKKKILYTDKNYINISIHNILSEILSETNSRKDTWIILNCDISELVSKEYKIWKTFLDILKDLVQNWYEFKLENNILTFKETIWKDKTTWNEFVEFLFDKDNIESKTIETAKFLYNSDNISNGIIVKDSWNKEDLTSINSFWRIEEYFSSGDKHIILNERKESIKELEITPNANNFFIADIWDLVKVYINSWSDLLFYDGNLKIIEKEFISWDLNKVNIKLSKWKIKSLNIIEKISEIDSKVNNLEL